MPKNDIRTDEFICKCCWRKFNIFETFVYRITGYIHDDVDNRWFPARSGFTICSDCMEHMMAFVEVEAMDIIEDFIKVSQEHKDKINTFVSVDMLNLLERRRKSLDALILELKAKLLAG
jgi:hypothetical protein